MKVSDKALKLAKLCIEKDTNVSVQDILSCGYPRGYADEFIMRLAWCTETTKHMFIQRCKEAVMCAENLEVL